MCDEEVSFEQIDEVGRALAESVKNLESLEIYKEQENIVHVSYKTDKSSNIRDFLRFQDYRKGKEQKDTTYPSFHYKDARYSFNRTLASTEDYVSHLFISCEPVGDSKRGMIILVDASGVIFIATCVSSSLGNFNLNLMSILYPDA